MSDFLEYLDRVMASGDLVADEFARAFQVMCLGGATPAQIAAFLTSYSIKGFSKQELEGMSKFLSFKLHKPIDDEAIYYVLADENHEMIGLLLSFVLSALQINAIYISTANSDSFLGHIGINSMNDTNLKQSISQIKLGIHIINYRYVMRNIYDVAHEIGLEQMIDELLYFYTPTSLDKVIRLYDIANEKIQPHIEYPKALQQLESQSFKTSNPNNFHTQIALLSQYLANPMSSDFSNINQLILSLLDKANIIHQYNSLDDLYNKINSAKLKSKLDYIIEATNRA